MVQSVVSNDRVTLKQFSEDHPIGLILIVAAIATLPAVVLGFPKSHSLFLNLVWHNGFAEQLLSGDLYPRWLPSLHYGLGSPVFFYYPPLAFYISSVVDAILPASLSARHVLGVTAFLVLFLSGSCSFMWFRQFTDRTLACVGATLYMLAPYHLAIDLYERGALAEFTTYIFIPALFLSLRLCVAGGRFAVLGPAASYCALILAHLPTAVLVTPFALGYLLFEIFTQHSSRSDRMSALAAAMLSMTAGFGLSSVYLAPALSMQDYITPSVWWSGYYHYSNWFLFDSASWPNPAIMSQVQYFAVTGLLLFATLFMYLWWRDRRFPYRMGLWFAGFLIALFLTTSATGIVWQNLTLLQKVQFPWRLMTVMDFCFATAVVIALHRLRDSSTPVPKPVKLWLLALLALWLPFAVVATTDNMVSWVWSRDHLEEVESRLEGGFGGLEYVPRWVESSGDRSQSAQLPEAEIRDGEGQVTTKKFGREIAISADMKERGTVALRSFYYPGWVVKDGDEDNGIRLLGPDARGRILLTLPQGRSEFVLVLERSRPERYGLLLSGVSLVFLCLMTGVMHRTSSGTRRLD